MTHTPTQHQFPKISHSSTSAMIPARTASALPGRTKLSTLATPMGFAVQRRSVAASFFI